MNTLIETLNRCGETAVHFAWPMLWQSSVLIAVLFVIDFALRRRVRAAVRYALWLVLLMKLLLPPSLALPTGIAWWLPQTSPKPQTTRYVIRYGPDTMPNSTSQPVHTFVPSPRPPISGAAWAIVGWSVISVGLLAWLIWRWHQVARDVRRATTTPAGLNELFEEAKRVAGLRRAVRFRLTNQAMSPAVCGLFRPVILLPQSLVQKLPPAQLRAVLLHELTHLRRGDVWMNCAQALVQIVYWWHPLLWFANARIRRVREEAVDDAVLLALRDDAETYAPTLLEVAKLAFHRPLASLGLVGILESRSALRQRIERLMDFRAPRKSGLTIASVLGILAFTALAIPMGAAPSHSSNLSGPAGSPATADNPPPPAGTDSEMAGPATMTFKIDRPTDTNSLKRLLLAAGVKIPPTAYFYTDNGLLLVRGDPEQLALVNSAVLKLNGYLPKEQAGEKPTNRGLLSTTNSVRPGDGRKVIYSKLNRIRFDQVSWPDGLPLSEVLRNLSDQTKLRDPDKKGINFIFHTNAPAASAATASAGGAITINPTTGLPEANPAGVAVDASSINVKLTLTDMRLGELLDAIVLVADHPIQYSILDDGIVFSPRGSNSTTLETRTFKVDPLTFYSGLQSLGAHSFGPANSSGGDHPDGDRLAFVNNQAANISQAAKQFFTKLGLNLDPPKSVFFNDRLSVLFVRATEQDLDTVENAIQVLNMTPPQIHIKARFVEVPEETVKSLGANSFPTGVTNLIPTDAAKMTGVLTDANFRLLLQTLEQCKGFENLAEPEVTTVIGRQTQMRATESISVVDGINPQALTPPGVLSTDNAKGMKTVQIETGPVIDVVPHLLADGHTIHLEVTASVTEFTGYDEREKTNLATIYVDGRKKQVNVHMPQFTTRELKTNVEFQDNQTVVLGGGISTQITATKETVPVSGDAATGEPRFREQTTRTVGEKKQLLVLITATLVDAAGNRIHRDDEMPIAHPGIPSQDSR